MRIVNTHEILVEVDSQALKDRYMTLKASTHADIVPVIKNNCNGLQFEYMLELYKELGVKMVATSYANEFYIKAKDDDIYKLSWTWTPDEKYCEVKNLVLCCKNFSQLDFCISHDIPYHIIFNICMNRGGFKKEDIPKLKEVKGISENVTIAMHCPYEDADHVDWYYHQVLDIKQAMEEYGFTVEKIHAANGELFSSDPRTHFDMCRVGSMLFLPQKEDRFGQDYNPITISSYVNSEVMNLKKGENIGYNKFKLSRDRKAVIVPVGYYNFESLKKVIVTDDNGDRHLCDVLNMMHDTMVVDITGIDASVSVGNKVILLDSELYVDNWNDCITRTFKLNKDLVWYEFL